MGAHCLCRRLSLTRSPGTLFRASQFLSEELPVRLAHRVEELGKLPDGLNEMSSIQRVKDWYMQSFEEITDLPRPSLDKSTKDRLLNPPKNSMNRLSQTTRNPSLKTSSGTNSGNGANSRRYFAAIDDGMDWPPELADYNRKCEYTLAPGFVAGNNLANRDQSRGVWSRSKGGTILS